MKRARTRFPLTISYPSKCLRHCGSSYHRWYRWIGWCSAIEPHGFDHWWVSGSEKTGCNTPIGYTGNINAIIQRCRDQPVVEPGSLVLLLPVMIFGGLLSGILVTRFAPEAEGDGTDAAFKAFHSDGRIRKRIPALKAITSILTIATGGSAGREGPAAQIAGGFGSLVADMLGLSPPREKDRTNDRHRGWDRDYLQGAAWRGGYLPQKSFTPGTLNPKQLFRHSSHR